MITICAFTTDDTDAPLFRLPVEPSDNGLRVPCRLMVDKVTTVPKSKLGAHIGRLDDEDVLRQPGLCRRSLDWQRLRNQADMTCSDT